MLSLHDMKAVADNGKTKRSDFYTSTVAPVNDCRKGRFCCTDSVMLTVLFLEVAAFVRLFMAN